MIFQGSNHSYSNCFDKNLSLAEVKEYNFLGNIIDNKGRFKRSAQELSKKGLKAFFSLKKYLSEFLHVPVELSCKLFDSLIRPIIMEVFVISCHLLIDLILKNYIINFVKQF
jgi:hypothetical protein